MTSCFNRNIAALFAFGGVALGSLVTGEAALALSQERINEQLGNIPVFTLSDSEGNTLSTSIVNADESESVSVTHVYISPEDAAEALEVIKEEVPELAESFQVTPIPLSQIYEVATQLENDDNVIFDFVPIEEEVTYAMSLAPELEAQQPGRVPLFLVSALKKPEGATEGDVSENEAENVGRFTLTNGDEEVIPMFFKQEQFDNILSSIQADQPDIADSIFVDVIWLENFISLLAETEDSDTEIQQYQMIPTSESITFTQGFQANGSAE